MADLAYIYLAFNEEVERSTTSSSKPVDSFPNAWAPPIASDLSASGQPRLAEDASTIQEPDVDFDTHSYPSFYL